MPTKASTKCAKCGERDRNKSDSYCRLCRAEIQREWMKGRTLSPTARYKDNARSYAREYVKRGKIIKKPCEFEGCEESNVLMLIEDYSKPLEIRWFCPTHHRMERRRITIANRLALANLDR